MKVLIVGSGGREHALAWRLQQSSDLTGLWVASGNAGTARIATNIDVSPDDLEGISTAARSLRIDLVVVGPEIPLAAGFVDRLDSLGIPAFGPTQAAAQIESSKSFALEIMEEAGVPCPQFRTFRDQQLALDFLGSHQGPVVVKADGLAAGKGVGYLFEHRLDEGRRLAPRQSDLLVDGLGEVRACHSPPSHRFTSLSLPLGRAYSRKENPSISEGCEGSLKRRRAPRAPPATSERAPSPR